MTAIYHRIISSSTLGPVRLVWKMAENRPRIIRILLSRPMETGSSGQTTPLYPAAQSASCVEIETICAAIVGRLEGDRQEVGMEMGMEMADLSACSLFQHSVLQAVRPIPFGMVSSYHQIADLTGNKKAARAVGQALAANPFPLLIPCHRVICANGRTGAYRVG